MRFFVFFLLSLDECFAPVTHESSKWRGEQAIRRLVNDAVSAERCDGAPHSRFVIVPPNSEYNNSSWLAQWESTLGCTCRGGRTGGEEGPEVKLCMRSVLKSWRSRRFLSCLHPLIYNISSFISTFAASQHIPVSYMAIYFHAYWICVDKCTCLRFRYVTHLFRVISAICNRILWNISFRVAYSICA